MTALIDITKVEADARAEIAKEKADKATKAIVAKLRELERAKEVVRGIEMQLADLKSQIADGTF